MTEGKSYGDSYEIAVQMVQDKRAAMEKIVRSHRAISLPDSLSRDSGVIDPNEK